jgi:acetyl esterase/lipase
VSSELLSTISLSEAQIRLQLKALGARFDEKVLSTTRDLYRPSVLSNAARLVRPINFDLPYGPAERHRLDIYSTAAVMAPVLVFVHGGGFVAGDKRGDAAFYSNVGHYFARSGFLTVTINYRLAPTNTWPDATSDVQSAVDWVQNNVVNYGGNPGNIVLLGQSAGASHVAAYLFDPAYCHHASHALRAAIMLSGIYDLRVSPLSAGSRMYFGADTSQHELRSPISHIKNSKVPLMIGTAELDPCEFGAQAFALAAAVTRRDGHSPAFAWFAGHNHVSTMQSLDSVQDDVGPWLRRFIGGTDAT